MFSLAFAVVGAFTTDPIDQLAWLAGDWSCPKWGGTFEERWSPPSAGTMMGTGRLIVDGKTTFMEFLSIESVDGVLTMFILLGKPSKSVAAPVAFKMTKANAGEAVFECPTNDFPSKITYSKQAGALLCVIEGVEKEKPAREEFRFTPIRAGGR
ncbi:MAG TPA: DUF6265 family protein [Fimbriimonadaceae bacterium]|nr:DUF6265 family protein [Fimbriimonadaceae bacterium]HRJ95359.1 DUF6265 family protein [Fimbriimonadaceae bacterium]